MSATILRANLPAMQPVAADKTATHGFYFFRDAPDADKPDGFCTLLIKWDDGLELYLDRNNAHVLMALAGRGISPVDIVTMLRESWEDISGISRVIDTETV